MKEQKKQSAYKDAGVDIDAAADLVEDIKPHIQKTFRTGVMSSIGGFGALFDPKAAGYEDPVLVSATDGVGTKIKIAIDSDKHDTIGIDLVAMCVNDLVVQGAEPLFFLDYFATGKLANKVAASVIAGVAEGCALSGSALIGGETAEMPGLYSEGDYDLAGFSVGAVERGRILTGDRVQDGDAVLGLASSGVHSNGYSLVRKIVKDSGIGYDAPVPYNAGEDIRTLADGLLIPTRIYVKPLLSALKIDGADGGSAIHGLAHITGGGLIENIPRVLPDDLTVTLDASKWDFLPVFKWLKEQAGLENDDLARTLNCGIGMIVIVDADKAEDVKTELAAQGESVSEIGRVIKKPADVEDIIIENMDTAWAIA